jgi:hypothetical protein
MKNNMGQKWYQSTAYDLPISRLVFLFYFTEPWPLKFKPTPHLPNMPLKKFIKPLKTLTLSLQI